MLLPAATSGGALGLDLASVTGWAYGPPGASPIGGEYDVGRPERWGQMLAGHYQMLGELIARYRPIVIAYEQPIHVNHDSDANRRAAWGLAGVTEMVAWDEAIDCHSAGLGTLRAAVLRDGRLPTGQGKLIVRRWCDERGLTVHGFNHSDAIVVMLWAAQKLRRDRHPHLPMPWDGRRFWRGELL